MKILTLSTYPFEDPIHGGQHRLRNMVDALESAGHSVQSCGVLGWEGYPQTAGFVPFPGAKVLAGLIHNPSLMEDWAIGHLFYADQKYYNQLARMIEGTPDLILCEQPWLFRFALEWRKAARGRAGVRLVYGSQNVEHELKHEIIRAYFGVDAGEAAARLVRECELEAMREADLIISVSQKDADWIAAQGYGVAVVAANGVIDRRASLDDVKAAGAITQNRKFALYCASSHPPNMTGFFDIFGKGAGCFPPDTRLVIAGAAGPAILSAPAWHKCAGLHPLTIDAGVVPEATLSGLLATAHAVLLPITQGGGTNLKAAEAIWTGKHVVATSKALRGFERFGGSPGVAVADKPADFLCAVREAMCAPSNQISAEDRKARADVLWSSTLKPLVEAIDLAAQ